MDKVDIFHGYGLCTLFDVELKRSQDLSRKTCSVLRHPRAPGRHICDVRRKHELLFYKFTNLNKIFNGHDVYKTEECTFKTLFIAANICRRMYVDIGLGHVDNMNIDTFS